METQTLPSHSFLSFLQKHQLINAYKTHLERHNFGKRLLHSHVDPWFIELCEKAQQQGSPWVHTYHTLYFEKDWNQGLEDWQININTALIEKAKQADIKIAIAHWLKAHLKQHYDIDTVYVPNGVDVEKCDRANAARFKTKHGIKDFILFASGISDIKNAGMFLQLAQALPEYPFVIIGRGITKKGLEAKFQVLLGANISVFGAMPHEDLLDAIAACKVFVVTSKSEGLPTVLMEAMALERSVVGVNTFGTGEVINSDAYGYLYEADDLNDLIAKTQEAYQHSKGPQARRRILEAYDWRIIAPQLDNIYQALLYGKT
jgi:glycosyltransferase involved in cell wall biosynthesis